MSLRIALCFSGQPRSYDKSWEYYKKNLIDANPGAHIDVFCHLWYKEGVDLNIIHDLYDAKYIEVDRYLNGDFDTRYTNTPNPERHPPRFTVNAFYSIFRSNLMRIQEEHISGQYDWVIRTRYDYALNASIPFHRMSKDRLYVPNCRISPNRDFCNDQFAVGSSHIMTAYCSTYMWLEAFYMRGTPMIGEDMLSENLKMFGLNGDNLVYMDMKNPFPPGPYNGTSHSLIRDDYDDWRKSDVEKI